MEHKKIPINIITGFLGSGKTTLLSEIIKSEGFKNAAIIINEFGQVGIDHMLIAKTDENIVELQNGCICCTIQKDLQNTLKDLYNKLKSNNIKEFDRVIIETTGLANPSPVIQTMVIDQVICGQCRLDSVVCVVDAVRVRQEAAADDQDHRLCRGGDQGLAGRAALGRRLQCVDAVSILLSRPAGAQARHAQERNVSVHSLKIYFSQSIHMDYADHFGFH